MPELHTLRREDLRLLAALERNVRAPVSALARSAKLARHVAQYRLHQLEQRGVVRGYYSVLNPSLLGLAVWEVYFSLRPRQDRKDFFEELRKHPLVWWHNECTGPYDAVACILCKSSEELTRFLAQIAGKHAPLVRDVATLLNVGFEQYTRGYILGKNADMLGSAHQAPRYAFSASQREVFDALMLDARMPLAVLAHKTGMHVKTVRDAIAKLEQVGAIVCFRAAIDAAALGAEQYRMLFQLRSPQGDVPARALFLCRRHPHITGLFHSVGPWQIALDAETHSYRQLCEIAQELRELMDVRRYEVLLITNASGDLRRPQLARNV